MEKNLERFIGETIEVEITSFKGRFAVLDKLCLGQRWQGEAGAQCGECHSASEGRLSHYC